MRANFALAALFLLSALTPSLAETEAGPYTWITPTFVTTWEKKDHPGTDKGYLEIPVLEYTPPTSGPGQVEVSVWERPGGRQEIVTHFGFYPNIGFKATSPEEIHNYGIKMPDWVAVNSNIVIVLRVVPLRPTAGDQGEADGSRLVVGDLQIYE